MTQAPHLIGPPNEHVAAQRRPHLRALAHNSWLYNTGRTWPDSSMKTWLYSTGWACRRRPAPVQEATTTRKALISSGPGRPKVCKSSSKEHKASAALPTCSPGIPSTLDQHAFFSSFSFFLTANRLGTCPSCHKIFDSFIIAASRMPRLLSKISNNLRHRSCLCFLQSFQEFSQCRALHLPTPHSIFPIWAFKPSHLCTYVQLAFK